MNSVFLLAAVASQILCSAAPLSPDGLLAKIREAQSWHDSVRMSVHTTIEEKLGGNVYDYHITYNHSDKATSWTGPSTETSPGREPLAWHDYGVRTPLLSVEASRQNGSPRATGTMCWRTAAEPLSWVSDTFGSAMWGYHHRLDGQHICDVLSEAELLTIAHEVINGESCLVISADTVQGHIEVAVSPEKGYNPVEYRINRSVQSEGVQWDLRDVISDFTQINDKWIPTKYISRFELVWVSSKEKRTSMTETTLSDIELNPVFDVKTFTLGIMPDGTNLTDVDFGIEYFLKDGKLDPYVDHYTEVQELHDEIAALVEPARPTDAATQSPDTAPPQTTTLASPATRFRLLAAAISTVAIVSLAAAFTVKWRIKRERKDGPPPNG
ncbi:MAG: hypothetical protein NTZ09_20505 [Candidatus Hydrogenedentes bacterium]|nr:hypothetical protein [Candidatus Hydrogenedentota bacterium]